MSIANIDLVPNVAQTFRRGPLGPIEWPNPFAHVQADQIIASSWGDSSHSIVDDLRAIRAAAERRKEG